MKKFSESILKVTGLTIALMLTVTLLTGCGNFDSPTASQPRVNEANDLWNPEPGDQIIPGHEVPILNPGYWESTTGQAINPAAIASRAQRVGPQGCTISLGAHRVIIPAGAVDDFMTITIAYGSVTGIAIDCGPSPFRFNVPVTIVLSYAGTQYANNGTNATPPPLSIVYMADPETFEPLPSDVDVTKMTVSAQTDHFSRYIIS
ncbi:hypothetical protein EHM69_03745 [candidate division KSB1 bacterium]|nr:MAG: hypothetical protein EHM69_03745 [candidate division KSB1 bacterium]